MQQKNQMLKICGILMIIGGSAGLLSSLFAIIGVSALAAAAAYLGGHMLVGLFVFACILLLASSALELTTGILGVKNCDKPEKVNSCFVCCLVTLGLSLLGTLLSVIAGGSINVFSLLLSLVVPGLYLYGAYQLKKAL